MRDFIVKSGEHKVKSQIQDTKLKVKSKTMRDFFQTVKSGNPDNYNAL